MPDLDRVKVIKGLEDAYRVIEDYVPSRYRGYSRLACCDAIDLLREQEPKWIDYEDTFTGDKFKVPLCGNCESLLGDALYCPRCGKAVKWDDN